jgi:hypothetical protein
MKDLEGALSAEAEEKQALIDENLEELRRLNETHR